MNGNPLYATGQAICRLATTLLFDLKVQGIEHVPRKGGVLIVANHQSYLDPVLVGVKLPRAASFLAKSELFEGRFFVGLIRMLNAFPVRQGRGDISAVREAINRLGQGSALVLFPEGTRTEDGELIHLEAGVGLIVRKTTAPVVPCAIEGSYRAWPRRRKMFRASPIRVMFGPPMELAGLKAQQIVDAIDATLRRMIVQLKQEIQAGDA